MLSGRSSVSKHCWRRPSPLQPYSRAVTGGRRDADCASLAASQLIQTSWPTYADLSRRKAAVEPPHPIVKHRCTAWSAPSCASQNDIHWPPAFVGNIHDRPLEAPTDDAHECHTTFRWLHPTETMAVALGARRVGCQVGSTHCRSDRPSPSTTR